MKKLTVFIFIVCACTTLPAQKATIDSLKLLLQKERNDAVIYEHLYSLGNIYYNIPEVDSTTKYLQLSITVAKRMNSQQLEAQSLTRLGGLHALMDDYPGALKAVLEALEIHEKLKDETGLGTDYNAIGEVYYYAGDYRQCIQNNLLSRLHFEQSNNPSLKMYPIERIGNVYEILDQSDSAFIYTQLAKQLAFQYHNLVLVGTSFYTLGNIDAKKGDANGALNNYRQSLQYLSTETNNHNELSQTYLGMAKVFQQKNDVDSSLYYGRKSYAEALKVKFTLTILDACKFLSSCFKKTGNMDSAYVYLEKSITLKNSLFSQEKIKKFQDLAFNEVLHHQQLGQEKRETQEKNKSTIIIYSLVAGLAFLALILYRNRLAQRIKLLTLRNRIASDLHDEVGSTLSSISISSTIIQKKLQDSSPTVHALLSQISTNTDNMMEAMSDIVWAANATNDRFDNVLFRMRSFAIEILEPKEIQVHFNVTEQAKAISLDMQQRKNMYLIFKEAINNAAKYADCTNVWIDIEMKGAKICMKIKDDGKGFSTGSFREMPGVGQGGNGLKNMYKRTNELNGKIRIDSEPGKGTVVEMEFTV